MKKQQYIGFVLAATSISMCNTLVARAGERKAPASSTTHQSSSAGGSTETFSLDPVHCTALFRVHHLGAGPFWGRFNDVSGTITFREGSETDLTLDITMAIDSVDSGSERLDGHLLSEDFFFASKYPKASFKSHSARKIAKNRYEVSGDLTMRGVTKPITVNVDWLGTADTRQGRRCGFETEFTVKRSDFGISYGVAQGVLGDEIRIIVGMEGIAVDSSGQAGDAERENGRQQTGEHALPPRMARFDKNGDGKLQKDEAPERMQRMFERFDANKDGALDGKEAAAMRNARRGGRSRN